MTNHALTLNSYQRYINLQTTDGLKLYNSALHDFESPVAKNARINLIPQDFQKLSDQMNCLGSQYRYDYLFKRVPLKYTIIPEIPAIATIAEDSTAVSPVIVVADFTAVPEEIIHGNF